MTEIIKNILLKIIKAWITVQIPKIQSKIDKLQMKLENKLNSLAKMKGKI